MRTLRAALDPKNILNPGSLRLLRWAPFVQGDEDAWLANAKKFTEITGVAVVAKVWDAFATPA